MIPELRIHNSGAVAAVAIMLTLSVNCKLAIGEGVSSTKIALSGGRKILQGGVSHSALIDLLERVGVKCAVHSDTGKLQIAEVRTGSDAFFQGVESGDEIKSFQKQSTLITLVCERNGKPYQVVLHALSAQSDTSAPKLLTADAAMVGLTRIPVVDVNQRTPRIAEVGPKKIPVIDIGMPKPPMTDIGPKKIPVVDINLPKPKPKPEEVLKDYDVELIIDITGSMTEKDGTGDLTKFEWCRDQVRSLVSRMAKYNHGINITIFNTDFQTFLNCTPGKVDEIYADITPQGYTDLVDPLQARLNAIRGKRGAASGRPSVLAVITDGLPNVPRDPAVVNKALIAYSQGMRDPDETVVTFLQIGDTFEGRDFCLNLDDNLVSEGAKYDFVDTTTFAELKQTGLAQALVKALEEKRGAVRKTPVQKMIRRGLLAKPTGAQTINSAAQNALLKERQDERHRLEKELSGN